MDTLISFGWWIGVTVTLVFYVLMLLEWFGSMYYDEDKPSLTVKLLQFLHLSPLVLYIILIMSISIRWQAAVVISIVCCYVTSGLIGYVYDRRHPSVSEAYSEY